MVCELKCSRTNVRGSYILRFFCYPLLFWSVWSLFDTLELMANSITYNKNDRHMHVCNLNKLSQNNSVWKGFSMTPGGFILL